VYAGNAASADPASLAQSPVSAETPSLTEETRVNQESLGRGFLFYPSRPRAQAFRIGIGAFYDAIDPAVMYGFTVRTPQFTVDARYGLGDGWSLKGHFNTMLVTTEMLLGGSYTWQAKRWSLEAAASAGAYYGMLNQGAFDAALISAEFRPELALGYDFGNIALSLRGSLLVMGPERVRIGGIWAGLDNSNAFVGHSEMLYVENTTESHGIWYFGLGAMTTRSYYQFWVLFPDTPGLYTYPRMVAGYEF
jgi:hypothetical protein